MKRILINAIDPEESRIAVVEDGVLQDLHVEIANREAYLGNIYKGRVVNIEPSIGAAFVNFGGRINGFLHASDVLPAYGREDFQLTDIVDGRARVTGDEGPDSVRSILDDDESASGTNEEAEASTDTDTDTDVDTDIDGDADAADDTDDGAEVSFAAALVDDEPGAAEDLVHAEADDERGSEAAADEGGEGEPEPAMPEAANDDAAGRQAQAPPARTGEGRSGAAVAEQVKRSRTRNRTGERPKSKTPIDQLLHRGQEIVVQVTKEGIGSKGPALTTYISLPGRSLVLMPSLPKCGVSRKIADEKERRRLKKIVRELDETGSGGIGFIVRTAGVEKTMADLQRDRDYLKKIWDMVAQRLKTTRAPALLYQESDLVLKAMRDVFSKDIEAVIVDSNDVYLRIKDFAEKLMPRIADRVKLHESTTPLFTSFGLDKGGIERDVETLYQPRVELPNGASLVIEQTEALVSIDVNSGRYKPGDDLEETAYRTNLEVIPEIVRQLRLRDLGGVIIIDFIDMSREKHRRALERKMLEALKGDRARIKVGRVSPFGLLEMTRQRVGPGLMRNVFTPCPHCKGAGLSRTVQSQALAVLRNVRTLVRIKGFSILQVYTATAVNDYLVNYKRREILDLEEQVGKRVMFKPEVSYPVDMVHYRFMAADHREVRVNIPAGLGIKV